MRGGPLRVRDVSSILAVQLGRAIAAFQPDEGFEFEVRFDDQFDSRYFLDGVWVGDRTLAVLVEKHGVVVIDFS